MRRGGLARRYLIVLVALVAGALVTAGAVQLRASYTENQAALVALQREKAHGAAARIEAFVRDIERQLGWTTHAPLLTTDVALDARQLDALRLQRQAPPITELTYIDAQGREQLFVSRLVPDRRRSGLDVSKEPRFLEARAGKPWFGPVYFRKDSEPYMTISAPLSGGGVAAADVNLKFILDVVSQIKVGKTGLALAVDAKNDLIAHPDISLVLQKTNLGQLPQVAAARTPREEDDVVIARDLKGVEVLTAHSNIPSLGWIVFVEQPMTEAFAPVRASAYRIVMFVLGGIALSIVASVVLARRLARPIQQLQESAARIGAGEMDHQIALRTGDELEALADEFNRMTSRLRESYATLEQKVEDRTRELSESLEQQTATAEVLRVISASPTDVQPVLDVVAENAARVCGATDALIVRLEDGMLHQVAHFGSVPPSMPVVRPWTGRTVAGRAMQVGRAIHILDVLDPAVLAEYPDMAGIVAKTSWHTHLAVPLMREGTPIGAISIRRTEIRSFTDKQIALLQTFADQAVIAIENVRLFKELDARNAALTKALDQQTATSDILRVISQSQTDVQPVFAAIVQSAVRLSGASQGHAYRFDGELVHPIANYGYTPEQLEQWRRTWPRRLTDQSAACEAIRTGDVARIRDVEAPGLTLTEATRAAVRARGTRSVLAVPMLRQGEVIGSISLAHPAVDGFTDAHVELLKTFADQAVIAIQNVRLFTELEARNRDLGESLERQTATAEILSVISRSPTDLRPVIDAVASSASRLCRAANVSLYRVEGDLMRKVAEHESGPSLTMMQIGDTRPITRGSVSGRAILDRMTIHVRDAQSAETAQEYPDGARQDTGIRATVGMPMLREGAAIGAFTVYRTEPVPFSDAEIALLQTFADQAVIAIENVRLFRELDAKNAELSETLEQQTATGEILRAISGSPTDVQPVFDTIVQSALRLLDGHSASLLRLVDETLHMVAVTSTSPEADASLRTAFPAPLSRGGVAGHVIETRQPYVVVDTESDPLAAVRIREVAPQRGYRSMLFAPMVREQRVLGLISVTRAAPGGFSADEIALLTTFADQAVIAIENVRLFTELETRNTALTEALDQQTATAEILRVISSSPTDVQPVLEAVASSAARLCGASDAIIHRVESGTMYRVVHLGSLPGAPGAETRPVTSGTPSGRAVLEGRTIHVYDIVEELAAGRYAEAAPLHEATGFRTVLVVPLMRERVVVGLIVLRRDYVQPFTDKQIALLQTFADQAVIAIENVRLFKELEVKNTELSETLEQQTATGEILRSISSSPTDVQPVFESIVTSALRLLDGRTAMLLRVAGDELHLAAVTGTSDADDVVRATFPVHVTKAGPAWHAVDQRRPYVVRDTSTDPVVTDNIRRTAPLRGYRSMVLTPMIREGRAIGVIAVTRAAPGGFSDDEVELLQTFADQAVIAIENVRLFTELQARTADLTRSVGELEALGEVGRAISSTLDVDRVLETIVSRANALAGTDGGAIYEFEEAMRTFHLRATDRFPEEFVVALRATPLVYGEGAVGRAAAERQPVQISDIHHAVAYESRVRELVMRAGYRSLLAVPLLSEDEVVGVLLVNRREPGEFPPRIVELLRTFAAQSALAIENARLFSEIEDKSRQLEAANRHKDEFLASMSHELRTPLNAVIGFSEVLLERMFGEVNDKQEEYLNDILASGRHLLSLINDILDLAKIEAGRMELDVEDFELAPAIDNALVLIRERATRKSLMLETRLDAALGSVRGDQRKIKQVLLNLLSNAVKFTPEGGRIEVRAQRVDGRAEVSVVDTGIGIATGDHEAVFEEFRQVGTDYAKKHEGTGLGLALARKFVELHGGRIWVKSRLGEGSTFTFTIPVV